MTHTSVPHVRWMIRDFEDDRGPEEETDDDAEVQSGSEVEEQVPPTKAQPPHSPHHTRVPAMHTCSICKQVPADSSEDEDDGISLAAQVAALLGWAPAALAAAAGPAGGREQQKRALCVADSSDDEPSQGP